MLGNVSFQAFPANPFYPPSIRDKLATSRFDLERLDWVPRTSAAALTAPLLPDKPRLRPPHQGLFSLPGFMPLSPTEFEELRASDSSHADGGSLSPDLVRPSALNALPARPRCGSASKAASSIRDQWLDPAGTHWRADH